MPLLAALLCHRYSVLAGLGVLVHLGSVLRLQGDDTDWQFFSWGSGLLFGQQGDFVRGDYRIDGTSAGGLSLYANYPELQIGPPALLVARLVEMLPGDGEVLGGALIQALALLCVLATERALLPQPTLWSRTIVLVGGGLVTVAWGALTQVHHLDDALVLTGLPLALWLVRERRPGAAGCALGLAAAAKPWAVVLLALVLLPTGTRAKLCATTAAVAACSLFWGPFVMADPGTLDLGEVQLVLSPASALAVVPSQWLPLPETLRLVQLAGGLALATLLVLVGRWDYAALTAFAWRLALEPSAYRYYALAVIVAAFVADARRRPTGVPVLTFVAVAAWLAAGSVPASIAAWLVMVEYVGLVALGLTVAARALLER